MRKELIGVIGASKCTSLEYERAYELGKAIAERGFPIVCGGLSGVMEAVSKGAHEKGGVVIGILPSPNPSDANPYVNIAIATGLGHARNAVIAHSAKVLIAIGGEYGTLSEIALALKGGKPVIALDSWSIPGVIKARSIKEAMELLGELIR